MQIASPKSHGWLLLPQISHRAQAAVSSSASATPPAAMLSSGALFCAKQNRTAKQPWQPRIRRKPWAATGEEFALAKCSCSSQGTSPWRTVCRPLRRGGPVTPASICMGTSRPPSRLRHTDFGCRDTNFGCRGGHPRAGVDRGRSRRVGVTGAEAQGAMQARVDEAGGCRRRRASPSGWSTRRPRARVAGVNGDRGPANLPLPGRRVDQRRA
jgi:hypothetical protein